MSSVRGVSPIVSILLIVVIVVAAALLLYVWVVGKEAGIQREAGTLGKPLLKIDGADLVSTDRGILYVRLYVRNIGEAPANVSKAYIMKNSVVVSDCIVERISIRPRQVKTVNVYPESSLEPGTYQVKVSTDKGFEAMFVIRLDKAVVKAAFLEVTIDNDASHPASFEDDYAVYEAWQEPDGGNYRVHFRIYAKPSVTIAYARAELFDKDWEHPDWVGGNPWEWSTPYTYPDWAGAYWTPVKPDEMPVRIVFSVSRG